MADAAGIVARRADRADRRGAAAATISPRRCGSPCSPTSEARALARGHAQRILTIVPFGSMRYSASKAPRRRAAPPAAEPAATRRVAAAAPAATASAQRRQVGADLHRGRIRSESGTGSSSEGEKVGAGGRLLAPEARAVERGWRPRRRIAVAPLRRRLPPLLGALALRRFERFRARRAGAAGSGCAAGSGADRGRSAAPARRSVRRSAPARKAAPPRLLRRSREPSSRSSSASAFRSSLASARIVVAPSASETVGMVITPSDDRERAGGAAERQRARAEQLREGLARLLLVGLLLALGRRHHRGRARRRSMH